MLGLKVQQLRLRLVACHRTAVACHRIHVMELAHHNHLAYRKTKKMIRLSFWWHNLSKDVELYCAFCVQRQLHARKRATVITWARIRQVLTP